KTQNFRNPYSFLSEFRRTELRSSHRLKDQTTSDRRETRREA
ncbi:hypothetical protein LINGRAHAP2_LOCUS14721, partial [Linum grandiflorum]